ncbi:unnamed protein product, partial [marine sediment metagenome]
PKFIVSVVKCLPPNISEDIKLKIIAEMNFLDPHKEPWPRHVRAKFAIQEFEKALERLKDEEEAYDHIWSNLEISMGDLIKFHVVVGMIEDYVKFVGKEARQAAERFGRIKFHFFEEFYNKAMCGKNAIHDRREVDLAKKLLYRYLDNEQLTSMTKVREFAQIIRYKPAKRHLTKINGSFTLAKSLYDDYAGPKRASTKVTRFCEWLEGLSASEKKEISDELKKRLKIAVKKL